MGLPKHIEYGANVLDQMLDMLLKGKTVDRNKFYNLCNRDGIDTCMFEELCCSEFSLITNKGHPETDIYSEKFKWKGHVIRFDCNVYVDDKGHRWPGDITSIVLES